MIYNSYRLFLLLFFYWRILCLYIWVGTRYNKKERSTTMNQMREMERRSSLIIKFSLNTHHWSSPTSYFLCHPHHLSPFDSLIIINNHYWIYLSFEAIDVATDFIVTIQSIFLFLFLLCCEACYSNTVLRSKENFFSIFKFLIQKRIVFGLITLWILGT